jgi:methyl-accepting chemotaxis protein
MAFKLTKAEETKFEELRKTVSEAFGELTSSVENYNEEIDKLRDEVVSTLSNYNGKLAELRNFVDEVAAARRDEFDEKSDSWKEGDVGNAADEWISTWESADLDDGALEFPDELQIDFEDHSEIDLSSEP